MIGTIVNTITVITGSLIGLSVHKALPKRFVDTVFQSIGLFTIFIGTKMAISGTQILYIVFSLILGALTGEFLKIEQRGEQFSDWLKSKLPIKDDRFTEGLVTSFLLFCMGSMTFLGAFEEGIGNPPNLLYSKSVLDGFSSIALASAFGIGVLFTAFPLLIFQGGLTISVSYLKDFISTEMMIEISAVGGVLLIGLGLSVLNIKKIKILNIFPAILYIILFISIFGLQ